VLTDDPLSEITYIRHKAAEMIFIAISADDFFDGLLQKKYFSSDSTDKRKLGHWLSFIINFALALFLSLFCIMWMLLHVVSFLIFEEEETDEVTGMLTTLYEIMVVIAVNFAQALTSLCLACNLQP
jgi:hypothetical protein